jgi:hypothetical protein
VRTKAKNGYAPGEASSPPTMRGVLEEETGTWLRCKSTHQSAKPTSRFVSIMVDFETWDKLKWFAHRGEFLKKKFELRALFEYILSSIIM